MLALLLGSALPASAERTLAIESFHSEIEIATDGSIAVEETIEPRFTGSWNGIIRSIPIQYRTPQGLNYTLRLAVESITDGEGRSLRYESSRERHYRKLKIWIPGATDATRRVRLRYRVANGLRFFDRHDELYWNVTGDEWDAPIERASALVRLPDGVTGVRASSFRGAFGSTDRAHVSIEPRGVEAEAEGLGFREGLTVVVGWDPGIVRRPTPLERAGSLLYGNLPLAIPPLVLLVMWRLWRARGRDPEPMPIATQYEPPADMTPAELGTLIDGRPDMRDITATIVDLAVRGHLRITEAEDEHLFGLLSTRDYAFERLESSDPIALKAHERDLLDALFASGSSVLLSELKNRFYRRLPGIRNELYEMLVRKGLYTGRPDRVRIAYLVAGIVVGGALATASGAIMTWLGMQPLAATAAGILSGLGIAGFGWFMPARTVRGARELEKVRGFEEFLSRVEGDRLRRLAETPGMFEKYLPYAMALGVEDDWAKAFEEICRAAPSWYSGPGLPGEFDPATFTRRLGTMSTQAASVMTSSPRGSGGSGFGGGGSSGGGFGGGGGSGF